MTRRRKFVREFGFEAGCVGILLIFLAALTPAVRQSVLTNGTLLNIGSLLAIVVASSVAIHIYAKKRKRSEAPRMLALSLVSSKKMEMVLCGANGSK